MTSNYGNESIRALSDKEAMRLRPANNLGSDSITGTFHALKEIVDNSIDEVKAGYGTEVIITKHKDNYYSVKDSGRGVPMSLNKVENMYNYELVFMRLNAGAKYNAEEDGTFEWQKGLNGIGSAATALTSENFTAVSNRDGKKYTLQMFEGDFVSFDIEDNGNSPTGTFIKWRPDLKVFKEVDIPFEWIREFAKEQAVVNKKTRVIAVDEANEKEHIFYYENGIQDYLLEVTSEKSLTTPQYFEVDAKGKDREDLKEYRARFQIAFAFNNEINMLSSYHNSSHLKHGGSPHESVKSAFAYAIHRYVTDNDLYKKKEKRITWEDVSDSLVVITNTYSMQTSYANQTKLAITNEFIKDFMNHWLREQLEIYFTENPKEAKLIAEQVLINKRSSERAEATRMSIKKKLSGNINSIESKVDGFYNCKSKDKSVNILAICEGKSSLSAMLSGRQDIHAIFPLRGKVLNCLKASLETILNNDVVSNLFKILGCGIEVGKDRSNFNIDNLRFSKVMIYVDSDFDGTGSILPLLLTAFWRLTPTLVKQGKIYICETPKYEVSVGDTMYYAIDDGELEALKAKLSNEKYHVHYIKGLAELSSEAMAMCLNPDYKNITQVTMNDIEKSVATLEVFMGSAIDNRKEIILESFKEEGGIA